MSAREGVETMISGESARNADWTFSETLRERLTTRTCFAQNRVSFSMVLVTWSASSREGTRIRAYDRDVSSVSFF